MVLCQEMTQQAEREHTAQPQGVAARPGVHALAGQSSVDIYNPGSAFTQTTLSVEMLLAESTQE